MLIVGQHIEKKEGGLNFRSLAHLVPGKGKNLMAPSHNTILLVDRPVEVQTQYKINLKFKRSFASSYIEESR